MTAPDPDPLPPVLRIQIADELVRARGEIELIGEALCADPEVTIRHMTALQAFDRIGQHLLAIAGLLQADDAAAAIVDVPLEHLRQRLHRAMS